MPERIQRRRTAGWRMPDGAVYVGRPSKWGNPFVVGQPYMWLGATDLAYPIRTERAVGAYEHGIRVETCTLDTAITWHAAWIQGQDLTELAGRDLACWCPLTAPCHGDNLLQAAAAVAVTRSDLLAIPKTTSSTNPDNPRR